MPEDGQSGSNDGQSDNKNTIEKPLGVQTGNTVRKNDVDEFGLPIRPSKPRLYGDDTSNVAQSEHQSAQPAKSDQTISHGAENVSGGSMGQADRERTSPNVKVSELDMQNGVDISKGKEPAGIEDVEEPHELAHDAPVSEWSHMQLAPKQEKKEEEEDEGEWQTMPAFATHAIYDDWGKVLAREEAELYEEDPNLGGAGKGYSKSKHR